MKTILAVLAALLFAVSVPVMAAGPGMSKTDAGVTATFKVTAKDGMVDLYLMDAKTKHEIPGAKAGAEVSTPSGKKVKLALDPMKMGENYSYMGALDMKAKGGYIFNISVTAGRKKARFRFTYENR
ncbi:MAG: hypothetical protein HY894_02110 [Deltaproteobacteria bacterium]|nr:hypothetical protein [Deltaproteobacteria bacterium]